MTEKKAQKIPEKKSPTDLFWDLMNSMQFAVTLLIILTLVSLIGVLLPQFAPNGFRGTMEELYISKYGFVLGKLLLIAGLDHVFSVWWYYLLLLMLCLSISVCSLRRLGATIARIRRVSYFASEQKFRQQKNNRSVKLAESAQQAVSRLRTLLEGKGYKVSARQGEQEGEEATLLYARRGAISHLGPLLTHISIVLIIVGAAISYMLSFQHFQWMGAGEVIEVPDLGYMASPSFQTSLIARRVAAVFGVETEDTPLLQADRVIRNRDWRRLPEDLHVNAMMKVRLEKFEANFTPQGKPKAYLSTVTVLDPRNGDKELFAHLIKVNDPLVHKGVYFYQSSYSPGGGGAQSVTLRAAANDSSGAAPVTVTVRPGGPAVELGGSGDSLRVEKFAGSFQIGKGGNIGNSAGGEDTNPAAWVVITRAGQEIARNWIFKNFPDFSHQAGGPYNVTLLDYEKSYLTGLSIRTHR